MSEPINVRMALLLQRCLDVLREVALTSRSSMTYAELSALRLDIESALTSAVAQAEEEM